MKQNIKVIIFLFAIMSFFFVCIAEDFWMKLGFETETKDIYYTVQDEIYITTGDGKVFVSKDKGNNWDSIPEPPSAPYVTLEYIDELGNYLIVCVIEDYYIAHKDTCNWKLLYKIDNSPVDMYMYKDCLYSLCWGGIVKSNKDWTGWNKVLSTSLVEQFNAFAVDSMGTVYAGSFNRLLNGGGIYRSFDDGDTWEWYPEQFFVSTMGVDSKGRIFAGCYDKIIRSIDNGETWQNMLDLSSHPGSMLINRDDEIFVGFDEYSAVLRSSDNGETWDNISTGIQGADPICGMAISLDGYIYLATDAGVYRSVDSTTGIEDIENIVANVELHQNYPNPFNNETSIIFSISENAEIDLSMYNTKGELVKNLINERMEKAIHQVTFNAEDMNSGLYFYRLKVNGNVIDTKCMLYLK
ncbi:MAG: T9SS type A sorting domain-containing protein [Candidatus Delongbacteria bacterium]|nr:T9SS type A sorting domain-containing protein [Candidatus Delongbacteria bacterium]